MSSTQRLVSPRLPTTLAGRTHVDLPGYDVMLNFLDSVVVLPTKLDLSRFEDALSRVLQLYPHAAGQVRSTDGRWFIELTNTSVPIYVEYKPEITSDKILEGDWVFQDDLSMLVNPPSMDHSAWDANVLLFVKLTFLENETCVGLSWRHVLGDYMLFSYFMHALSQFYQGLPQKYPSPTFDKFLFPKPTPAMLTQVWPFVPHLHTTAAAGEIKSYADLMANFRNVQWRVEDGDLEELRAALSSRVQNGRRFSQQDCLSAYVIAVLNRSTCPSVRTVMNAISLRNLKAPFIAPDVAGNMFATVSATVPTTMAGIATAIRDSVSQFRDLDYLYKVLCVETDFHLELRNAGKEIMAFLRDDTVVYVNSYTGIDAHSAHFGYPDAARVFLSRVVKHMLRCHRSNPVKGDDGVWRARKSVDFSFGVSNEVAPRMDELFGRGVRYMLANEQEARL